MQKAHHILNDQRVFEGSGYRLESRGARHVVLIPSERLSHPNTTETLLALRATFPQDAGEVDLKIGLVRFPEFKLKATRTKSIWNGTNEKCEALCQVQWDYLRIAAEEESHVAQFLKKAAGKSSYLTPEMQSGILQQEVREMAQQERLRLRALGKEDRIAFEEEADVYAHLINIFGIENVPVWYGMVSGYRTRSLVDAHFGRGWTESELSQYWDRLQQLRAVQTSLLPITN
jgi:hypothetical protein